MIEELANENLVQVVGLLHAVGKFAEIVLASRDVSELHGGLAILGTAAGVDRVYTFRIQGSPGTAILDQAWVAPPIPDLPHDLCIQEAEISEVFATLRRGEAYQGHPETREGVNAELNDHVQTLSDLILPIAVDGELVGAIGFDDCHNVRFWSEEEIRVLESAASIIAAAIQRQQAERSLREINESLALSNTLLGVVAEISSRFAQSRDCGSALMSALRQIGEAAGLGRVLLLEERPRDDGTVETDHHVVAEWCAEGIANHRDVGLEVMATSAAELFMQSLRCGKSFWYRIADLSDDFQKIARTLDVVATGCAPIFIDNSYWGTITFDNCKDDQPWDEAVVHALTAAANAIAGALQSDKDDKRLAIEKERVINERELAAKERSAALAKANQSLRSGASVLSQSSSPEDVLSLVLEQAMDVTGADTATLVERNGEGSEFSFRTFIVNDGGNITNVSDPSRMPRFHLTPLDDTYFSHLLQGKPGQIRIDAEVAKRCPASEHIFCREGDGVMWAFPFMTQGVLNGYMALGFDTRHSPDSVGLETAEALACQASLVLETLSLTERTKALEAVREREMAVQSERTRLSEEMHDGLQQTMAAISLQVGSALVQIRHDPQGMQIRKPLKRAAELAEQGLKEIRDSVRDLSAGTISSTWAFVDAVSKLCTSIDTDSTRCVAKVTCELNELPASSLQNIYRVIQEAAQNVVKHAGARYMEISIRSAPDSFIFTVSDDGCGITLSPAPVGGMGFRLMKERARRVGGRLEIAKLERGGTQVTLVVEKAQSKVQ